MVLENIKIIGFDLDGTLYPLTDEIQKRVRKLIYKKLANEFKVSSEKTRDLFEEHYAQLHSGSKVIRRMADEFDKPYPTKDIVQDAIEESDRLPLIKENPKLCSMLERLSKSRLIDLLTGSKRRTVMRVLKKIGINPNLFGLIYTRDDVLKYGGEIYKKWLTQRKDYSPDQFLYIGDNPSQDILAPKRLGIKTCFLGENKEADFCIPSIMDLEHLILI